MASAGYLPPLSEMQPPMQSIQRKDIPRRLRKDKRIQNQLSAKPRQGGKIEAAKRAKPKHGPKGHQN